MGVTRASARSRPSRGVDRFGLDGGDGRGTMVVPWLCIVLAGCGARTGLVEPIARFEADATHRDAVDAADRPAVNDGTDSPPVGERVTRTFVISGSGDDALQDPGGPMRVTYDWVSLYSPSHLGGLRFVLGDVPRGAMLESADLVVWVDSVMEDDPSLSIARDARRNPPAFSTLNRDIGNRSLAPERVAWIGSSVGQGAVHAPSLVPLVQPVLADPGYVPGNALVLVFMPDGGTVPGHVFEFRQVDFGPSFAAQLTLVYLRP